MTKTLDKETLARSLRSASVGNLKLDQMFWYLEQARPRPLPGFEDLDWKKAVFAGRPGASMTTDVGSILKVIEAGYPSAIVDTKTAGGKARVHVDLPGYGTPISGEFQGILPTSQLALGLAIAFLDAHEAACEISAQLSTVAGVNGRAAPTEDWPIELHDGRWYSVNHEERLAAGGVYDREKAGEYAAMTKRTDFVMLRCRERYEDLGIRPPAALKNAAPNFSRFCEN